MNRHLYQVTAGNVGTVYQGHNRAIAEQTFNEYASDSVNMYGRVAGEEINLWVDGDVTRTQVATCPHI